MTSRGIFAVAALLTLPLPALATVVVAQSLEEMTASAQVIVHATVGPEQTRWDDAHRRINTYTELKVTSALKGKPPSTLVVRQPGGEVGPVGQRFEGVARFKRGEEVVIFLEHAPDEPSVFSVYSLGAGKVSLERSRLGELRAVRHLEDLAFYAPPGSGASPRIYSLNRDDLGSSEEFLGRVRRAVSGGKR